MNANMNSSNNNSSSQAMPRKIVGAEWVTNPRPWWVPAGLEETQGPGAKPVHYKPVFFGAEQEWKDDEQGFQLFQTRRSRQWARRASRRRQSDNQDTYDFDDTY